MRGGEGRWKAATCEERVPSAYRGAPDVPRVAFTVEQQDLYLVLAALVATACTWLTVELNRGGISGDQPLTAQGKIDIRFARA